MIAWLKIIHIGAVTIWMAGLVSLPGLYVQRAHDDSGEQLLRLQRMVRFAFLRLVSPAAFIAVATGLLLIFIGGVFAPWLSAKLAIVGLLALLHTFIGLVMIRLFREGQIYPVWRFIAVTAATVTLILAVLYLVLAKPSLDFSLLFPGATWEPGGLQRLFWNINPWPRS